jgi:hypothetical protein
VCERERDFLRKSYQRVQREAEEERTEEEEKRGKRRVVMAV